VVMPFWSDNNILFLAGKGDGNIRYYEYENDNLIALDEHKSTDPQRGMCFLPRRALNVADCEIARAYKIAGNSIEPIAFIVPRKAEGFQSDIFPPAPSYEPSVSAQEFFGGKNPSRKLVDLSTGVSFAASSGATTTPTPAMSTTQSAPAPAPAQAPSMQSRSFSSSSFTASEREPSSPAAPPTPAQAPTPSAPSAPPSRSGTDFGAPSAGASGNTSALEKENSTLKSQLREARELIRNLELQVEAQRANARKAAKALLDES